MYVYNMFSLVVRMCYICIYDKMFAIMCYVYSEVTGATSPMKHNVVSNYITSCLHK